MGWARRCDDRGEYVVITYTNTTDLPSDCVATVDTHAVPTTRALLTTALSVIGDHGFSTADVAYFAGPLHDDLADASQAAGEERARLIAEASASAYQHFLRRACAAHPTDPACLDDGGASSVDAVSSVVNAGAGSAPPTP
jgi:hypothetical protein